MRWRILSPPHKTLDKSPSTTMFSIALSSLDITSTTIGCCLYKDEFKAAGIYGILYSDNSPRDIKIVSQVYRIRTRSHVREVDFAISTPSPFLLSHLHIW